MYPTTSTYPPSDIVHTFTPFRVIYPQNKGVSPGWIVFGVWICLAVVVLLAWLYITKYKQSELQLAHITSHLDKVATGIGQILTRAAKQPSEPTSEETSLRLAEVKDSHDVVFQSFNPAYSASSAGSSASAQRLTEEEQVDINNIADPEQRVQMVVRPPRAPLSPPSSAF
jgi:hypothetical protein